MGKYTEDIVFGDTELFICQLINDLEDIIYTNGDLEKSKKLENLIKQLKKFTP